MQQLPDSGFKTVVDGLTTGKQSSVQPTPGHTFVGYRRKAFDDFVALFKFPANSYEHTHDRSACEQIVKNTRPGSEIHEAAKKALKHWPSA